MNVFFLPNSCLLSGMWRGDSDEKTSLKVGMSIILGFAILIVTLWACGYLPGTVGRTFSLITGFLWTPLIMEPTLFTLGLFAILILNHHRRTKNGSELVYLESVDGPDAEKLPAESRSAIFEEKPHPPSGEELVATIEGAAALGDHKEALRLMLELPEELLESEEILAVRLQFAKNNNDPNHIRGLSRKLREVNPEHPLLKS